jgi:hypothetical protein
MNAMNAINAINDQKNNATTCNQQPNGGGKVTPAHYEELEELQLESVTGARWGWWYSFWGSQSGGRKKILKKGK